MSIPLSLSALRSRKTTVLEGSPITLKPWTMDLEASGAGVVVLFTRKVFDPRGRNELDS